MECDVSYCERTDVRTSGYCTKHHANWRRNGTPLSKWERMASEPKPECAVDDCTRDAKARGYCNRHYENVRKYGYAKPKRDWTTEEVIADIGWNETESGCWEWKGSRNDFGYGLVTVTRQGLLGERAHRLMFERANGPIPAGLVVRHKCDNPPCVNPDHLELGTQQQNVDDMVSRGRHWMYGRTECPNGHDVTAPGALKTVVSKGMSYQACVECARERSRKWAKANRARKPKELRTHCKNGHDLSEFGVQRNSKRAGKKVTACIACERESSERFRAKRRASRPDKPKVCRNGHDLSLPGATKRVTLKSGPDAGREYNRCVTCYAATQKRLKSRGS